LASLAKVSGKRQRTGALQNLAAIRAVHGRLMKIVLQSVQSWLANMSEFARSAFIFVLGGFVFLLFAIILGVVRSGWRFSRFHVFGPRRM